MKLAMFALATAVMVTPALAVRRYSSHPGEGALTVTTEPAVVKTGDTVLVDDHSCPAGQIKEVTGGDTNHGLKRSRRCITASH